MILSYADMRQQSLNVRSLNKFAIITSQYIPLLVMFRQRQTLRLNKFDPYIEIFFWRKS
jgi:hypothetical protein